MTQELGKLQTVNGENIDFQKYPLGSRLYLYPYHVSIVKPVLSGHLKIDKTKVLKTKC